MNDNVIFMICYIPTPIILLIVGLLLWRIPPKYRSDLGYRTKRSLISEQAWDFSQTYYGRLMTFLSIPTLTLSLITGVIQIRVNPDEGTGLLIFCIVTAVQLVPICVSIPLTETAIKRNIQ